MRVITGARAISLAWVVFGVGLLAEKAGAEGDLPVIEKKQGMVRIPVMVGPEARDRIKELQLFAAEDEGGTWRQVDDLGPSGKAFRFEAARKGTYWLATRLIMEDGTAVPADLPGLKASLRVKVTAEGPAKE